MMTYTWTRGMFCAFSSHYVLKSLVVSIKYMGGEEPLIVEEGAKLPELLPVCISSLHPSPSLLRWSEERNANECIKSRLWHLACQDKEAERERRGTQ